MFESLYLEPKTAYADFAAATALLPWRDAICREHPPVFNVGLSRIRTKDHVTIPTILVVTESLTYPASLLPPVLMHGTPLITLTSGAPKELTDWMLSTERDPLAPFFKAWDLALQLVSQDGSGKAVEGAIIERILTIRRTFRL